MTLVEPDTDFRQERSEQTKIGLAAKSRRGKGPVGASKPGAIKERRAAMLPEGERSTKYILPGLLDSMGLFRFTQESSNGWSKSRGTG